MKYSLFSLVLPECTPVQAAKLIKDAGYDGVEWRCAAQPETLSPIPNFWTSNRTTLDVKKWKSLVPEYRSITSDHGLEFSSLATYCRADQPDDIKVAVEIAKELGCPRIRICAPPYDGKEDYHSMFKRVRKNYEQSAVLLKSVGIQGLLELHAGNLAPSASLAFRLLDGIDPTAMGVMYDPGNMVVEGFENWKMGCQLLGSYLAYCHVQNSRFRAAGSTESGAVKWAYEACELHTGLVDYIEVFKALKSVGYDGWMSNEDHYVSPLSSFDRIKGGLQHLKQCAAIAAKS